jgi:hypothetical protein
LESFFDGAGGGEGGELPDTVFLGISLNLCCSTKIRHETPRIKETTMFGLTSEPTLLFCKVDSFSQRQAQLAGARQLAEGLDGFDLAPEREQAAIEAIVQESLILVPVLDLNNVEFEEVSRRTHVRNMFGENSEQNIPHYVFDIPFVGDPDVFSIQPSTFSMNPPRAEVHSDVLQIELRGPLVERI